ncbi:MAG TPA: hypothetical protein VFC82_02020 [Actinomycetaceae bacterium]|nr:hypothetical protein [Actinomycetaceae bacterium]
MPSPPPTFARAQTAIPAARRSNRSGRRRRSTTSTWSQEALDDLDLVAFEPDPKSRMGASRFIGRSAGAGRVLVVIAFRDADGDLHGINAWPATGADLTFYLEGVTDGQDN